MATCLPILLAALACASSRRVVEDTFDAEGLEGLTIDVESGDVEVRAAPGPDLELVAELSAHAGSAHEAERRLDEVVLDAARADTRVVILATGPDHTRTDLALTGASDLDLDLDLADGSARLEGTRGAHTVSARGVRGRGIHGTLDVEATSEGVDLEVFPDGPCRVSTGGPLVISLPYGLDYELIVVPDPSWGADVADLGFDTFVASEQRVEGRSGSASLRVELRAVGGPVVVLEATP